MEKRGHTRLHKYSMKIKYLKCVVCVASWGFLFIRDVEVKSDSSTFCSLTKSLCEEELCCQGSQLQVTSPWFCCCWFWWLWWWWCLWFWCWWWWWFCWWCSVTAGPFTEPQETRVHVVIYLFLVDQGLNSLVQLQWNWTQMFNPQYLSHTHLLSTVKFPEDWLWLCGFISDITSKKLLLREFLFYYYDISLFYHLFKCAASINVTFFQLNLWHWEPENTALWVCVVYKTWTSSQQQRDFDSPE